MIKLADAQKKMVVEIRAAWAKGAQNVMPVLPTGTGKTVLFAHLIARHGGRRLAIAHRRELVCQMSLALCKEGVYHAIIGTTDTIKYIISQQHATFKTSLYSATAAVAVAGVDTIIARQKKLAVWLSGVDLVVLDEGHHLLKKNKWGRALDMCPSAKGLFPTATPLRADGHGLGRGADGLVDALLVGPSMRECIDEGLLLDYTIFAPPNNLDLQKVKISSTGDYAKPGLRKAVAASTITGDVVGHYLKLARGKLGITFAVGVEAAKEICHAFNRAGVPAEVVTATTTEFVRGEILRRFKNREILQLVNVDLFGEGFDLPAIEVVSFARPTQSYGLYCQQFGRALRPNGGPGFYRLSAAQRLAFIDGHKAVIIDHVGNVYRHGLPETSREWSLDRREKRNATAKKTTQRTCVKCTGVYSVLLFICPYCSAHHVPAERGAPEHVDGDLFELDKSTLLVLKDKIKKVDMPVDQFRTEQVRKGAPPLGVLANVKRHRLNQEAQTHLRKSIDAWVVGQRRRGIPDAENYRVFYHAFGIDVLSAQSLNAAAAEKLRVEIEQHAKMGRRLGHSPRSAD